MADIPNGLTPRINESQQLLEAIKGIVTGKDQNVILKKIEELKNIQSQLLYIEQNRYKRTKRGKEEASSDKFQKQLEDLEKVVETKALAVIDDSTKIVQAVAKNVKEDKEATKEVLDLATEVAVKSEEIATENAKEFTRQKRENEVETQRRRKEEKTQKQMSPEAERALQNTTDQLASNILGPLKLISDPFKSFTGIDFEKKLSDSLSSAFKRDKKKDANELLTDRFDPKEASLKKAGLLGAMTIFLANTFKGGEGKRGSESGFSMDDLKNKVGEGVAGLPAGTLMKGFGIASLAAGVLWGVVDGITAWGKSQDWGVSKVSAAIGGFFAGSGEGGLMDAFKGLGKWALIGAGVGSVVPVIGTIAGGLVGSAIGGILGFIGGEKVSGAFQAVGEWFRDTVWAWTKETAGIAWKVIEDTSSKVWGWVKTGIDEIGDRFIEKWNSIKTWFVEMTGSIGGWFIDAFSASKDWVQEKVGSTKAWFSNVSDRVGSWMTDSIDNIGTWIGDLKDKGNFKEIKDKMNGWFDKIGTAVGDWVWNILPNWAQDALNKIGIGLGTKEVTEAGATISRSTQSKVDQGELEYSKAEGLANKEYIQSILDGWSTNKEKLRKLFAFEPSKKMLATIGITSSEQIENLKSGLAAEPRAQLEKFQGVLDSTPVEKVKDALIYKSGRLIEPSPQDNIVLTKDTPRVERSRAEQGMTAEVQQLYFSEKVLDKSNEKFDKMIALLSQMLEAIGNQEYGMVVQNVTRGSFSMDALRMGS